MNFQGDRCHIFAVSNFNFRKLALNWSRALDRLGIKNYTVYSLDEGCHEYLLANKVSSKLRPIERNTKFSINLTMERYKIIEEYLCIGVNAIYSDLDAIWLEDPLADLIGGSFYASTSIHKAAAPKDIMKKWGYTICSGWLAVDSSCLNLIREFILSYDDYQDGLPHFCDQGRLNRFLFSKAVNFMKNKPCGFSMTDGKHDRKIIGLPQSIINRANVTWRLGTINTEWYHLGKVCHPRLADHHIPPKQAAKKREKFFKKNNIWFVN